MYYLTLAVAAWCPASKLVVWRFWRREANICPTCIPAKAIARRLSSKEDDGLVDGKQILQTEAH